LAKLRHLFRGYEIALINPRLSINMGDIAGTEKGRLDLVIATIFHDRASRWDV
jgi:hypothetical protein